MSDIDVGLLLSRDANDEVICDRVRESLMRALRTTSVDVVSLRHAPMPLRYRVVRDGIVLRCRDRAAFERFFVESVLQYLDFKVLRDRGFETQRGAILQRR
jgi:hypothetical protein